MKKKHIRAHLGIELSAQAVATKSVPQNLSAGADAAVIELVLLSFIPQAPFTTNQDVDSRRFTFNCDQVALIERYNAGKRKANLNIEHNQTGDTRSRGVVWELTSAEREPGMGMEPGVTYAWVLLSELGKQEMADRLWLYTSAEMVGVWEDESTYRITKAIGLALTNTPATEMPMNFSEDNGDDIDAEDVPDASGYTQEQSQPDEEMLQKILEALGLTAEADEATVLAALAAAVQAKTAAETAEQSLSAVRADLTAAQTQVQALAAVQAELTATVEKLTAAEGQVQSLTAELTTAKTQLEQLTAEQTTAKLTAAVDAVIAARKATPAQRDALLRSARADFSAFQDTWKDAVEVVSGDNKSVVAPQETHGLTAEQLETAKRLNTTPESYAQALAQARGHLGL